MSSKTQAELLKEATDSLRRLKEFLAPEPEPAIQDPLPGGRYIDCYNHLNDELPVSLTMTIPELAKVVVAQNYGTHRFLSALVHELRKKEELDCPSQLAPLLEDALNRGLFY